MHRRFASCCAFAAVLLGLVLTFPGFATASSLGDAPPPSAFAASWAEVERLIGEDKLEEALPRVETLIGEARSAGDEATWTRALVEAVRLRSQLYKAEDAARFLKAQPWPTGAVQRAVIDLYYAEALERYSQLIPGRSAGARGWRPRASSPWSSGPGTRSAAAMAASREAWSLRQDLGEIPLSSLHRYLMPNNYPSEIRGTMRDALTYQFVEILGNREVRWNEDSEGTAGLDLPALIRGEIRGDQAAPDHPLREMAAVLGDLEAWHLAAGRREAALEARLTRMRWLHEAFTDEEDRRLISRDLEAYLEGFRDVPWWSMGMATLAELLMQEEEPGHFARAHAVAVAGRDAWPDSPGGKRCATIASAIELPGFRLEAMKSDGLGRRSLAVTHKNLSTLYFRAHTYDLQPAVGEDLLSLVAKNPYVVAWKTELPETPDFDWHTTWVVPPIDRPGAYVVVASSQEDFDSTKATGAAVRILLSDLVLVTRNAGGPEVEVLALSGATGEPVAGAEVRLYGMDRKSGINQIERTEITDAGGALRLPLDPEHTYSLIAKAGGEMAEAEVPYAPRPEGLDTLSTLLYTDRAVYRPQQTIHWKVLAYRGSKKEGRFTAQAGQTVTVTLHDAGDQVVTSRTVTTNGFGTASGEIEIPAGRLLGLWRLESEAASQPPDSEKGVATVQVEEYKRPTFEVVLDDPAAPLRLGAPAKLTGHALYYFGLPVARGKVRWQVFRSTLNPWWWRGDFDPRGGTVATGTSDLGADGTFAIAFTPTLSGKGREELIDLYNVSVSVTDDGGETRDTYRFFLIGRTSIEGWIASDRGFLTAGRPAFLTITRRDLNGTPRPGGGSWSLYELRQPERALLPAEEPVPGLAENGFHTPGDALSPRWNQPASPEIVLRGWPEGKRLAGGELRHGSSGEAEVKLPALRPGAYRLRYETLDDAGNKVESQRELIVAGARTPLALPAVLKVETATVRVGGVARLLVHSGLPDQTFFFEVWRGNERIEQRTLRGGESPALIERAIGPADRGGLGFKLLLLRDHQLFDLTASIQVPWDDRELEVGFSTFRDHLRPGARETWKVTVRPAAGRASEAVAAEVLAAMTDRSLELFADYKLPDPLGLYPDRTGTPFLFSSLGSGGEIWSKRQELPAWQETLREDRLLFPDSSRSRVSFGPLAMLDGRVVQRITVTAESPRFDERRVATGTTITSSDLQRIPSAEDPATKPERPPSAPAVPVRSNFAETAFWQPHLLTGPDGTATIEFTVPDAVTSWNVFVQAVTRDLKAGTLRREVKSARDLLVRPYLPRFLREGDRAELKAVVTNARKTEMQGEVMIDVIDPETGESRLADFGLTAGTARLPFTVEAGGGTSVTFPLTVPGRIGPVAFKVTAVAGDESDGELRPVPVLPSRVHLAQSRFAVLQGQERRELRFPDLERNDDATRIDEQLVVTIDGQLFQGVLAALPYLVNYPYECTEQTLNRFLSTGIVSTLFDRYPAVARMAADLAKRETPLESWDAADPNRKLSLEETPFLAAAQGGDGKDFIKVLDPRIARAQREESLAKLAKTQLPNGAFPWWPGGPSSDYMTAYLLYGFAKAAEFKVDVPRDAVRKGWSYLAQRYRDEQRGRRLSESCCLELLTFINYVASAYPDPSWMGDALTEAERQQILDASFAAWRDLSPHLRSLLALTLKRMGRPDDARLVFDSVMDRAKTTPDEGTFWQPEERSWLWYNDTIESHAFALRALMELRPDDPRRHGLVKWLFLSKQLNHWKSTRATAEVLDSLVRYLQKEGQFGVSESATVKVGGQTTTFTFEPDRFTGQENRVVIPGDKIDPTHSAVVVEKETPGFLFAAATWHFSTDEPVKEGNGDLFHVSRRYFLRITQGKETMLEPLDDSAGTVLKPGDEVEVHLTVSSRAAAEYVHLRDPRAAGLEPESLRSGSHWDLGLVWYEETRDSATNFFFESLPAGTYTLKYRLRANLAGEFRVGPATLQSMYAPEFTAYSGGGVVRVKG